MKLSFIEPRSPDYHVYSRLLLPRPAAPLLAPILRNPGPAVPRRWATERLLFTSTQEREMKLKIGFPQHYAAASLKRETTSRPSQAASRFPQHYAAASLKRVELQEFLSVSGVFSAALRCGLIEAERWEADAGHLDAVFRSITLRPH